MDRDLGTGPHVDPLADLEVQRALALARARESYPAVPRETLLGYCEAAWDVALKADPRGRDLQGSFDRALLIIAWTQRRSGGRVPLKELIDQTVPRIALEPFIAEPKATDVGVQPEEPAPSRRSPLRMPFSSPIPVGAAVAAAGVVGVGVLSQAEVIPIAPLQPAGSDEAVSDDVATRDAGAPAPKQPGDGAAQGSGDVVAGLMPDVVGDAAGEAFARPAAPSQAPAPAAPSAELSRSDGPARGGQARQASNVEVAAQTAGAEAAPPAPVAPAAPAPPAPPPAQPVVRVEMTPAPTAMILEISAPQRPAPRPDEEEDESATPAPEETSPVDPGSDQRDEPQPEQDSGRDRDDEERGAFDVLEDLGRDRDDDEDIDQDELAPEPAEPTEPPTDETLAEETPAEPAPAEPAPAEPVPTEPVPAQPALAPAEAAPVPVEPAPAPAPAEPAPAPAAPTTPPAA